MKKKLINSKTIIDQIKNIAQEEKYKPEIQTRD